MTTAGGLGRGFAWKVDRRMVGVVALETEDRLGSPSMTLCWGIGSWTWATVKTR